MLAATVEFETDWHISPLRFLSTHLSLELGVKSANKCKLVLFNIRIVLPPSLYNSSSYILISCKLPTEIYVLDNVGCLVGARVGGLVLVGGRIDGLDDGCNDGCDDGFSVGCDDGSDDG